MAELRLAPPPRPRTPRSVPSLRGLLLLGGIAMLVAVATWPWPTRPPGTLVDPARPPAQVLVVGAGRYRVPAAAGRLQEIHPPATMHPVAVAAGYGIYAPNEGGGGAPGALYVRSGNDLFIPLVALP